MSLYYTVNSALCPSFSLQDMKMSGGQGWQGQMWTLTRADCPGHAWLTPLRGWEYGMSEIIIQSGAVLEHNSDKAVIKSQGAKALTLKEEVNNFVLKLRALFIKRYH